MQGVPEEGPLVLGRVVSVHLVRGGAREQRTKRKGESNRSVCVGGVYIH